MWKVNVDNSCHLETSMIYRGGLIRDHNGSWIKGFAANFGKMSVLGVELKVAYEGIKLAVNLGSKCFVLESDNNEVVNMLQGKRAIPIEL